MLSCSVKNWFNFRIGIRSHHRNQELKLKISKNPAGTVCIVKVCHILYVGPACIVPVGFC